jgi:hypothetical protein
MPEYIVLLEILFEVSILTKSSVTVILILAGNSLLVTMLENIFNKMDKTNEGTFDLLLHQ